MDEQTRDCANGQPPTIRVATVLQTRDREELERTLAGYRPYLYAVAERSLNGALGQRVDSSDAVQEAMLRGVAKLDEFRGTTDAELAAWLKQILDHLLIEWHRFHTAAKRDHRQEVVGYADCPITEASPSSKIRRQESFQELNAALQKLTPDQKLVVTLRNQDLTFEEIGRQMARTADAARILWARSIARLGILMKSHE